MKLSNIKHLILTTILCALTIFTAKAQIGTYGTDPNTATISASGSTLTINVTGDATEIGNVYNFSNRGGLYKKTSEDPATYQELNWDEVFDSNNSYYEKRYSYSPIADFEANYTENYTEKVYTYTKPAAEEKQIYEGDQWNGYHIVENSVLNLGRTLWDGSKHASYYAYKTDDKYTHITVDEVKQLPSVSESNGETYLVLRNCSQVYVSSNGGESYSNDPVQNGTRYNASNVYATRQTNYDLQTVEQLVTKGYVTKSSVFIEALKTAINADKYTTIEFVGGGTIDTEIIRATLYPKAGNDSNTDIRILDFGGVVAKDLTGDSFIIPDEVYRRHNVKLETLTLPLVPMVAGDIVVPSNILADKGAPNTATEFTKVIVPEGYTKIGEDAFTNCVTITDFVLPSTITEFENNAFKNCSKLVHINATSSRSIVFPENLETIGEYAFTGCTALASTAADPLEFPASVKYIKAAAFNSLLNVKAIKLNEGLEFIGNSAFMVPSYTLAELPNREQKTMEYPSTLRYMGPGCFANRIYDDVFFKSEIAPAAPNGDMVVPYSGGKDNTAFDGFMHMANNGFDPTSNTNQYGKNSDNIINGYANRENYINHEVYFAILHFRDDLTMAQAETFTDVTRNYQTYRDAEGNFLYPYTLYPGKEKESKSSYSSYSTTPGTEGYGAAAAGFEDTYLGMQKIWPSQQQWMRSYIMNSNGLKWDGVTKYRPTIPEDQLRYMAMDNLQTGGVTITDAIVAELIAGTNSTNVTNANYTETTSSMPLSEYLSLIAYQGTRRFVLADADTKETPHYPIDMEGGRWWTFCVPFNMTKAEVDKFFGVGTHVCLFSGVERDVDSEPKHLTLKFQHDVYAHYTEKNNTGYANNFNIGAAAAKDEQIVVRAHEAYMIFPTKTDEDAGIYINKQYQVYPYTLIEGSPVPTAVLANAGNTGTTDHTEYRYVGNYQTKISDNIGSVVDVKIPMYSYFYARKGSNEATPYQFWFLQNNKMKWSGNKCVVQNVAKNGGETDNASFFTNQPVAAKQISMFGDWCSDPDYVTGIQNVTIVAGEGEDAATLVYGINGQLMDINSVEPGNIYIKNGKKFSVK